MNRRAISVLTGWAFFFVTGFLWSAQAQTAMAQASPGSSETASAAVPHLIQFSGTLKDMSGHPIVGMANVTFTIYADEDGGQPLWMETQNVTTDAQGKYSVFLGAQSNGVPDFIFNTAQGKWLGVRPENRSEMPRILLVSVPYALKAGDANTLGGLPPSAFLLAGAVGAQGAQAAAGTGASTSASASAAASPLTTSDVTTTGGTANFLPLWTGTTTILNSVLFQSGTKVGINNKAPAATLDVTGSGIFRGLLQLPATGTATASKGFNSQPQNFVASVFNSSASTPVAQTFQWQAEPVNNDKSTASGKLDLLYASGSSVPAETGLSLSNKGIFTFSSGQTFPGTGTITGITTASGSGLQGGVTGGTASLSLIKTCTSGQILHWTGTAWACSNAGTGTIAGVTAGTDLTGGGTSGNVTLNVNTTALNGAYARLAAPNAFTATQNVTAGNPIAGVLNLRNTLGGPLLYGNQSTTVTTFALDSAGNISTAGNVTANGNIFATTADAINSAASGTAISGFETDSNNSDRSIGVAGQTTSTFGVGVKGTSASSSATGAGLGFSGVWGDSSTPADIGVLGTEDDGNGVVAITNSGTDTGIPSAIVENLSSTAGALVFFAEGGAGGTCAIDVSGNLSCTGSKSAVVPVHAGQRMVALYAEEAAENWFADYGTGQLVNGDSTVQIGPTYAQTVNTQIDYHVFLTPRSDCKGLYVTNETSTSFEVRELQGGTSNIAFDYRIVAKRKGYESIRLADRTAMMKAIKAQAVRFARKPGARPSMVVPPRMPGALQQRPSLTGGSAIAPVPHRLVASPPRVIPAPAAQAKPSR